MSNVKSFSIQNFDILIDQSVDSVFNPHPISLLLANSLRVEAKDSVLDVGTGSGIFAITAAKLGASSITATDLTQDSITAAKRNTALNDVIEKIAFFKGYYFEPLNGNKYDIIVSNPPCMPFPKDGFYINPGMSLAVNGGEDGSDKMIEFIEVAGNYLKPDGYLLIPISKWSNWKKILSYLDKYYEAQMVSSGYVQFYLAEYDQTFHNHILMLNEMGLVDIEFRDSKPYAEILIYKAKLKNTQKA